MEKQTFWEALPKAFSLAEDVVQLGRRSWVESTAERESHAERAALNQVRVTEALIHSGMDESALAGSWGYGYGDRGRAALEKAWSQVFSAEAALVRPQIATGTQALYLCLGALLRPGDGILTWPGSPYDTLQGVLATLADWGVGAQAVPAPQTTPAPQAALADRQALLRVWLQALAEAVQPRTRVVLIQRSRGYTWRPALTVDEIRTAVETVRAVSRRALIIVDNCYGEFVEEREPTAVGADACVGSLIKNPGGGVCPTGGYIVGRAELVHQVAERLYAPRQAGEVGPTGSWLRLATQGFFLAPHAVGQALQVGAFAARLFRYIGFPTEPGPGEPRGDIVQAIALGSRERIRSFCRGLQQAGPVDAYARPEAWSMPGYEDKVIMAGGTFVPGASLELGADAPIRPPYAVFLQGGVIAAHGVIGCLLAAGQLYEDGLRPDGPWPDGLWQEGPWHGGNGR